MNVSESTRSQSPRGTYSSKSLFGRELLAKISPDYHAQPQFHPWVPFLLFKSASVSEQCHKYKQNVKIAGEDAASQITVININLFPTTRLSYSLCIIKLSSGWNIEIGRKWGKEKVKKRDKHSWNLGENVLSLQFVVCSDWAWHCIESVRTLKSFCEELGCVCFVLGFFVGGWGGGVGWSTWDWLTVSCKYVCTWWLHQIDSVRRMFRLTISRKNFKSSCERTFKCPRCQRRQLCIVLFNYSYYLWLSKALTEKDQCVNWLKSR